MKTAISIPDQVFRAADELAGRLGISRSELYVRAVARYLEEHNREGVTAALDAVYQDEDSTLDPILDAMQIASLPDEAW